MSRAIGGDSQRRREDAKGATRREAAAQVALARQGCGRCDSTAFRVGVHLPTSSQRSTAGPLLPWRSNAGLSDAIHSGLGDMNSECAKARKRNRATVRSGVV